jgi:accessory gene regulator B
MIIIVLSALKYLQWNPVIYLSFVLLASIFIFLLAPVEDSNKPLDAIEQRVYQKRSRVILVFLLLITFLFAFIGKTDIAHCLSISIIAVAIMVVLGKIKSQ